VPCVQLLHQHAHRLQHIERLEAGDDHGALVFLRKILVRAAADHGADVRRADEPVDPHLPPFTDFGGIEDALNGGWGHYVIAINAEIG
jgi:hypothetical protein